MGKAFDSIGKAIGGLFGGPKAAPKQAIPASPRMPDPESPAAKLAAKKKVQARTEKGRSGTIYSDFSNQRLGGTS